MSIELRDYQQLAYGNITEHWRAGSKNVLYVAPCRSGKTVVMSKAILDNQGASIVLAHRAELLQQMSLTLARNGIFHKIIGPSALSKACTQTHIAELGRNFISAQARCYVASAQTLMNVPVEPWMLEVTLVITDEGHHYHVTNSWTKALHHFVNARGLSVTATPIGSGGKGLGRHADGLMDAIVVGPDSRELIRRGFLTDYRIIAPQSDIDLSTVAISASGDFSPKPLADAVHKSKTIVGDVVGSYLKFTPGKLGMTFCVDIESATEISLAYRAAGVSAEVVTGKTPTVTRRFFQQQHKQRKILQLVSVDLYGEGIDVPDLEVVSMARPTNSLGLFVQQFWRGGNPRPDKPFFTVIDHVGNVLRHKLPDAPRAWTLDRAEKRGRSNGPTDGIPLRTCLNEECLAVYERILPACPYCGRVPVIAQRGSPELVDGDLCEMSEELLARLRGEILSSERLAIPYGATPEIVGACKKRHRERGDAQAALREMMALWGGWRVLFGESDAVQQRRFFHTFQIDCMSAQALNKSDADELTSRIVDVLRQANIEGTRSYLT